MEWFFSDHFMFTEHQTFQCVPQLWLISPSFWSELSVPQLQFKPIPSNNSLFTTPNHTIERFFPQSIPDLVPLRFFRAHGMSLPFYSISSLLNYALSAISHLTRCNADTGNLLKGERERESDKDKCIRNARYPNNSPKVRHPPTIAFI